MSDVPQIGYVPPDLHVATLNIVADEVTIEKKEKPQVSADPHRPVINACWLALLVTLVTVWFGIHLKVYVTQLALLGTATVWSVVQIVIAQFGAAVSDESKALRKRLMERRETTWHLWFLNAVAGILFFATSSLYVQAGKTAPQRVEIRVRERAVGEFLAPVQMDADARNAGGAAFSRFRSHPLALDVVTPSGYHTKMISLAPGGAAQLTFPDDFEKQTLVRFYVPLARQMRVPPRGGDRQDVTFLEITAGSRKKREPMFATRSVYVGVTDAGLARTLIAAGKDAFESARRDELAGRVSGDELEGVLNDWRSGASVVSDWNLKKGETVSAKLIVGTEVRLVCSAVVLDTKINDCVLN